MVKHNPDETEDIADFTGLGERSIRGYAMMLDKIQDSNNVAERSSYKMFRKEERQNRS